MASMTATKQFRRMMGFMKPRAVAYYSGLAGSSLVNASVSPLMAFILKDLLDAAVKGKMDLLVRAVLLAGGVTVVLCILAPLLGYLYSSSVKKTMAEVRKRTFQHLEELPLGYYENNHSGDMISRLTNDTQAMEQAFSDQLMMVAYTTISGLVSTALMLLLDWRIALVMIGLGGLSALVNTRFAVPIRRISDRIQQKTGTLTERLTDLMGGLQVIRMFQLEKRLSQQYREANADMTGEAGKRVQIGALLDGSNFLLIWLNFGGIMMIGCLMVIKGSLEFGTLIALVQLLNGVSFMFSQLGAFVAQLQGSLAGAARVFELLDCPAEEDTYQVAGIEGSHAAVEFQNVTFGYEAGKNVLDSLSLRVGKGQVAALVGASGCGKSTVLKLLLGFYGPGDGAVTIGGRPLKSYTLDELRKLVAYVPQEAYLFNGTIEENIRYGRPEAKREEVELAAKAANAHEFILEQPDGYETLVGERGARLSGGQKQRIAIARALLKDAPLLLLDEATSALDSESERLVQDALEVLMKGRTVIAVAHRLSTIQHADVIYVLEEGRVAERGNHEELLGASGLYRNLYELQYKAG